MHRNQSRFIKNVKWMILSILSLSLIALWQPPHQVQAAASAGKLLDSIVNISGNMALDKNGILWRWNDEKYQAKPILDQVKSFSGFNSNTNYAAVKKDGSVWIGGYFTKNVLNSKTNEFEFTGYTHEEPVKVEGLPPAQAANSKYALDTSGNVWAIDSQKLTASKMAGLSNIVSLDSYDYDSALDKDGNVWVWEFTPAGRTVFKPEIFYTKVKQLSGGVAIDSEWNGYLLSGSIYMYKHGGPNNYPHFNVTAYSSEIKALSGANVDMGIDFSLLLKKDGSVWSWSFSNDFNRKIQQIKGISQVSQISAKAYGGTALHADGTVSSWKVKEGALLDKPPASVKPVKVTKAIQVLLNGKTLKLPADPLLYEGRIYIPVRGLIETLGGTVHYANDKVTLRYGDRYVELTVWSKDAAIDGKKVTLDAPARIEQGNTVIPLRFTGEALGIEVKWNPTNQTVELNLPA
ncbi:stalk domain-containing protein [Paenibacillus luteus]|uniref:stalk domain-containing protein n=1 Tax=Paenibacillus luteus TaxID=2545753 RepID=UPI0011448B60|nr:stalk domain-containing protein [Paenibacillus luteus]